MNTGNFGRLALPLLSLTLLLAACGGGDTTAPPPKLPPPVGTPITSLADSGPGTLRDLLASAKAGDTLSLASGTITLAGPLKISKSVTLNLGSSMVDAAGKGRALEIPSGITVTIKDGTLKSGTGAPITVASVGSQALSVATYGGVLINAGMLTLDGTVITGGRANVGGGIANFKTGTLILKGNSRVSGNTAEALPAGATETNGAGGGIFNGGSLTISGGSVSMNTTLYAGGGIYGDVDSTITLSSGKVDGNATTFPITTANNVTQGSAGGGIYSNGDVTITGGSVSGNTAVFFGAGVTVQSTQDAQGKLILPQFTLSGGMLENNRVTDDVGSSGGGVWTSGNFTMTGGTVRGNSAPFGGGITVNRDGSITGGTIENNQARTKNGGGILAFTPTGRPALSKLTFGGTATVRNNTAGDNSGGIAVSRTTLTMTGGSVTGNTAVSTGGGISLGNTNSTIQGGVISNNKVSGTTDGGGGVRIFTTSKLTLSGGEIKGNQAVLTGGGMTVGGQVIMTGGEISGNAVTGKVQNQGGGGGVRLYAGAKMTASGGTISGNTAPYGAGVTIDGPFQTSPFAEFMLSGANVTGNVVTGTNVGGGFFNDGKLTISSGSVTGNTATTNGGGVFNRKNATYTQPGGSVTGNNPDNVFSEK